MEHQYKSHKILITTWGRLDGFTPELRINKQVAPVVSQSLKISQPFPTKAEAESFALQVARKWIDEANLNPTHKHRLEVPQA